MSAPHLKRPIDQSQSTSNDINYKIRKVETSSNEQLNLNPSNYYQQKFPNTNQNHENHENLNLTEKLPAYLFTQKVPRVANKQKIYELLNFIYNSSSPVSLENVYKNYSPQLIQNCIVCKFLVYSPQTATISLPETDNIFEIDSVCHNNSSSIISDSHRKYVSEDVQVRLDSYCFYCHEDVDKFTQSNVCDHCCRVFCSKTECLNNFSNGGCCLHTQSRGGSSGQNRGNVNSGNHTNPHINADYYTEYAHLYQAALQNLIHNSGILNVNISYLFDKAQKFYSHFITTFIKPSDLLVFNWFEISQFHLAIKQLLHNCLVYSSASSESDYYSPTKSQSKEKRLSCFIKAVNYIETNLTSIESCPNCYNHIDYRETCKFHSIAIVKNSCKNSYRQDISWPALILERVNVNRCLVKFIDWEKCENIEWGCENSIREVDVNDVVSYNEFYSSLTQEVKTKTDETVINMKQRSGYSTNFHLPPVPKTYTSYVPPSFNFNLEQEETESCVVCKVNKGEFSCGNCFERHYCSVDCQTVDWQQHRNTCKPSEKENKTQTQNNHNQFHSQNNNTCTGQDFGFYDHQNNQAGSSLTNQQDNYYRPPSQNTGQLNYNNQNHHDHHSGHGHPDQNYANPNNHQHQHPNDRLPITRHDDLVKIHPEINRNANVEDIERIVCPICNKLYSNKGNLKSHIKVVHKLTTEKINEMLPNQSTKGIKVEKNVPDLKKMQCPICKQYYRSRGNLRVHLKGTHKMSLEEAREYLPKNTSRNNRSLEEKCKCPMCDKMYMTKQSLRFHMKSMHEELTPSKISELIENIPNIKYVYPKKPTNQSSVNNSENSPTSLSDPHISDDNSLNNSGEMLGSSSKINYFK